MPLSITSQETKLKYLENTYLFEYQAKVVDIFTHDDKTIVVLDETIFYPQGGGQPRDIGYISSHEGNFEVQKVVFTPEGFVWHTGDFLAGNFEIGQNVSLKVDQKKRLTNAKNHSAGHLIDWAVEDLSLDIKPVKGYHFEEGQEKSNKRKVELKFPIRLYDLVFN